MTKANDDAAEEHFRQAMRARNARVDAFIADMYEHRARQMKSTPRFDPNSDRGRELWNCVAVALDRMDERLAK